MYLHSLMTIHVRWPAKNSGAFVFGGTEQGARPLLKLKIHFINYFPDGTVKNSGNYRDGPPEGLWIKWTADQRFYWEGYYQHGRKNKKWKLYSSNRRLIRMVSYRQGKYMWRKDMNEVVGVKVED